MGGLAGYSEHHTGYAIDLGIYTDQGQFGWVFRRANTALLPQTLCAMGLFCAMKETKPRLPARPTEPWHFRYVGRAHAFIMAQKGFCLEEYIDYLRGFSFAENHLTLTDFDKTEYEIYFVPAASAGDTTVPVPANMPYTVSGNNVDGFIVTCTKPRGHKAPEAF